MYPAGQKRAQGDHTDNVAKLIYAANGALKVIQLRNIESQYDGPGVQNNDWDIVRQRRLLLGTGEKGKEITRLITEHKGEHKHRSIHDYQRRVGYCPKVLFVPVIRPRPYLDAVGLRISVHNSGPPFNSNTVRIMTCTGRIVVRRKCLR